MVAPIQSVPNYSIAAKRVDTQIGGFRAVKRQAPTCERLSTIGSLFYMTCFLRPEICRKESVKSVAEIIKISELIVEYRGADANELIRYTLTHGTGKNSGRLSERLQQELLRTHLVTSHIDLHGIPITNPRLLLDILKIYPHVKTMDLSSCKIEENSYEVIGGLLHYRQLEALDLSHNQFVVPVDTRKKRHSPFEALREHKKLTHLRISHISRSDAKGMIAADLAPLHGSPSLTSLDVSHTTGLLAVNAVIALAETTFSIYHFQLMPKLRQLVVTNCTDLTAHFIQKMRQISPHITMIGVDLSSDSEDLPDLELLAITNTKTHD